MSDRLAGKVAVVTGASKGIGAGIAVGLAKAGASVIVNYARDRAGADRVVAEISRKGGKAVAVQGDVSKAADLKRLFAEAIRAFGRLDVLVNNAGVYRFGPVESITEGEFHRHYDTNVLGPILAVQEALKHFGPAGGSVINISSVVGSSPWPQAVLYSSTKAAVDNLTRGLALEAGPAEGPGQRRRPRHHRVRGHVRPPPVRGRRGEESHRVHPAGPPRHADRHRPGGRLPGVRRFGLGHRRGHPGVRRAQVI